MQLNGLEVIEFSFVWGNVDVVSVYFSNFGLSICFSDYDGFVFYFDFSVLIISFIVEIQNDWVWIVLNLICSGSMIILLVNMFI